MNPATSLEQMVRSDNRRVTQFFVAVFLVIVIVYALVVERSPGWQGLLLYIGYFVILAFELSLYFVVALLLLNVLVTWSRTIHLFGFPTVGTLRANRWIAKSMKIHKVTFGVHVVVYLLFFLALGFTLSHRFTAFGIVLIGTNSIMFISETLRPAAVLYLANSSPEKLMLQARIKQANLFHRVVALLDMDATLVRGKRIDVWTRTTIGHDCMRTDAAEERVWKNVVEVLLRQVPLVVLDARDASPAVMFEVRRLFLQEYIHKTLFVVGPQGEAPVLDIISYELPTRVAVATASEGVTPTLASMVLQSSEVLPSLSRPTTNLGELFGNAGVSKALKIRELGAETKTSNN